MSNWWQQWAEQVGQTLAELWLESRAETQIDDQAHIPENEAPERSAGEKGMGHSSTPSQDKNDDT